MRNRTFRGQPPSCWNNHLPLLIDDLFPHHQISLTSQGCIVCSDMLHHDVNPLIISHLWRCAGGQASAELSDPGRCCGVGGADQNRAADLHGVSLRWRGQAGLMGHSQRGKGVPLLTVLLLSSGFLGAVSLGAWGRGGRPFTGVSSAFRWLVQFYKLSCCTVKLKVEESVNGNNTLCHILLLLYLILDFLKCCEPDSNPQCPFKNSIYHVNELLGHILHFI